MEVLLLVMILVSMEVGLRVHRCDQGLRKELVGKAYGGKDNYLGKYGGKTWGAALCSGIMKRAGRNTPRGGGGYGGKAWDPIRLGPASSLSKGDR